MDGTEECICCQESPEIMQKNEEVVLVEQFKIPK
jgi:hypothetical protein